MFKNAGYIELGYSALSFLVSIGLWFGGSLFFAGAGFACGLIWLGVWFNEL